MTAHRVLVTGLGQVSALGLDVPSFAEGVFLGRSGVRRLESLGLPDAIGAALPHFDPKTWVSPRALPIASRAGLYAARAAQEAFTAARLDRSERTRGGVLLGTGFGGIAETEETYRACFTPPGQRPRPAAIPMAMANSAASLLASELRLRGENLTIATACSSATHAIGMAFRLLRGGGADLVVAGGADAPLTPVVLAAWAAMRVLAPPGVDPERACRPFSPNRQGIVVGEGAGCLVLETEEHASARGVSPLAEVIGYGSNADAGHITHPDLEGVKACIRLALEDAGLRPEEIQYVNAHGTGTLANDATEALALAEVFGSHASRLMVSSTKAVHGHAMGAGGALETVATVLALSTGRVPPTGNLDARDPSLPPLDFVPDPGRKVEIDYALKTSFAFGGNNAALVLRRAR